MSRYQQAALNSVEKPLNDSIFTQICHHLMHFPLLILLPLFIHHVHKPSDHTQGRRPQLHSHSTPCVGAAGKRVYLEHGWQQAFLCCAYFLALDIRVTACFFVLPRNRPYAFYNLDFVFGFNKQLALGKDDQLSRCRDWSKRQKSAENLSDLKGKSLMDNTVWI
ncbi:hypothetical protein V6N11_062775 [Hibiscus sabdariffa]|uniref:Uncharacterized protein n=1 Tax=Hibiscus sabdariffa TaxID=183260 RepID=A0ABR2PTK3_9ROSI